MLVTPEVRARIDEMLQQQSGIVLEQVARAFEISMADVIACLPPTEFTTVAGNQFVEVMQEVSAWGPVTLIINTPEMVFEGKGPLRKGKVAGGYYNIPGVIGGHFKPDGFATISFLTRELMGRMSKSIFFLNRPGQCVFKIYLGRDNGGGLLPEQVTRFEELRKKLEPTGRCTPQQPEPIM